MNPILIVDDEAAIAMLVRRILTEAGYRCQAVTDSRAAANLLEKNRYDLVLLDVMMPHLDGYDLLAYLRPTGTPCIFITAKDAVAERVRGLNSGADDYIVKPFAPTELVARVESVLRAARRAAAYPTPEPLEQDPGISEELRAALNTLAPLDRALILERVLDGLDYAVLACIHGRPAAYLRTRYHRAKKQLAQRLKEGENYEV